MKDSHDFLVGTVVGFQALAGEVKIRPSTNNPDLLAELTSVRVKYAGGMNPEDAFAEVLHVRTLRVEKRMLIMSFKGLLDRNAVEHLDGATLYCNESELLPLEEEEFWIADLVGMDVFTTDGALVGKVVTVISAGSDLLEVQSEKDAPGKTILIPFVKQIVPLVDMNGKRIEVTEIPGLLEAQ